ncbi:hypothetical protein BX600DRAFT_431787 [Xylariales sp. PMI_506]|nr:hypothetical protein BX600DRAFT_431787 [Xylariales sp. PMI_506]
MAVARKLPKATPQARNTTVAAQRMLAKSQAEEKWNADWQRRSRRPVTAYSNTSRNPPRIQSAKQRPEASTGSSAVPDTQRQTWPQDYLHEICMAESPDRDCDEGIRHLHETMQSTAPNSWNTDFQPVGRKNEVPLIRLYYNLSAHTTALTNLCLTHQDYTSLRETTTMAIHDKENGFVNEVTCCTCGQPKKAVHADCVLK